MFVVCLIFFFFLYFRNELLDRERDSASVWDESWVAMKAVMKVKTFQIIVLQGLVGSLPWTAMVFFTLWFQLIGEHVCVLLRYVKPLSAFIRVS